VLGMVVSAHANDAAVDAAKALAALLHARAWSTLSTHMNPLCGRLERSSDVDLVSCAGVAVPLIRGAGSAARVVDYLLQTGRPTVQEAVAHLSARFLSTFQHISRQLHLWWRAFRSVTE